jgi:drug/metabolite transporter (DMT)-like permease
VVESFRVSDVSRVSAFRYSAILWAVLLGAVVWGNSITFAQSVGMFLVVLSGAIITVSREAPKTVMGDRDL